jgi:hypothetical protein
LDRFQEAVPQSDQQIAEVKYYSESCNGQFKGKRPCLKKKKKRTKTTNKSLKTAASGRGRQYFCLVTAFVLHHDGREIPTERIKKLRRYTSTATAFKSS